MPERTQSILICGGGFAGLAAARALANRKDLPHIQITVLDASVFHVYRPWLYEVATFAIEHDIPMERLKETVCLPMEPLEQYFPSSRVRFVCEKVTGIDLASKTVHCESGHAYTGDAMVYALGSVVNDFGIPGISEHAYTICTPEDGIAIHEKIQELFRLAQLGKNECRVVIGGGGFTGVELAGELANYVRHMEQRHHLPKNRVRIEIVEAQDRVLGALPERIHTLATMRLKSLGVRLQLGQHIKRVSADRYELADGTQHRHEMFVWGGGIMPHPLAAAIPGMPIDDHGRVMVDTQLQVQGREGIFALGDTACFTPQGGTYPLPPTGQVAHEEGTAVAENIAHFLTQRPLVPARIVLLGFVIPIGGHWAIAAMPHLTFAGFLGYLVRRFADFRYIKSVLPFWDAVRFFFSSARMFTRND